MVDLPTIEIRIKARRLKKALERLGPDNVKRRVRSGDLHPLEALDLLNRQRLAGGKPSAKLEAWCERRWQRRRRGQA